MEFKVLKKTKTTLELECLEKDPTILNLLAERLDAHESVSFSAFRWNHPLLENPVLYVEVKRGKDVAKVVEEVVKEILKEIESVEKAIKK